MQNAQVIATALISELRKAIVGKDRPLALTVTALLAGGHVLVEDLPGLGKTTLARALSRAIGGTFARIQFTPDLLPSDITGSSVFNQANADFEWRAGPIFRNLVLADEINRATPRTQSALLEAMGEGRVSADGETHNLPSPFMVVATQNPVEFSGTYLLPESQLDRFMLRFSMGYPAPEAERAILDQFHASAAEDNVQEVASIEALLAAKAEVHQVRVDPSLRDYLLAIVADTRKHPRLLAGASPRASLEFYRAAQAFAVLQGRDYVIPDDIKDLAVPVLAHRVLTHPTGDGVSATREAEKVVHSILSRQEVPV
ncbi:MAG: MoxR family ATPase [Planctomycetes bacterium]|nr:MoxR family ATPase [Planctomycetota bacterium]